jgi:altronate dehydratase small subunit
MNLIHIIKSKFIIVNGAKSMNRAIILHAGDNVATAIADLDTGETVAIKKPPGEWIDVKLQERIPLGHKFACEEIADGGIIRKYGETIGCAVGAIGKGMHVHVHNLKSLRGRGDLG